METIGIIGSGHLGTGLARIAVRAGRHVVIANSRFTDANATMSVCAAR